MLVVALSCNVLEASWVQGTPECFSAGRRSDTTGSQGKPKVGRAKLGKQLGGLCIEDVASMSFSGCLEWVRGQWKVEDRSWGCCRGMALSG